MSDETTTAAPLLQRSGAAARPGSTAVAWRHRRSRALLLVQLGNAVGIWAHVVALVLLLVQGAQAGGALLWGRLADVLGLCAALLLAAALMAATVPALRRSGLYPSAGIEPVLASPLDHTASHVPHDTPLVVAGEYVAVSEAEALADFLAAAREVRRSRLRLGAQWWELLAEPAQPGRHLERYRVTCLADRRAQVAARLTLPERAVRRRLEHTGLSVSAPRIFLPDTRAAPPAAPTTGVTS